MALEDKTEPGKRGSDDTRAFEKAVASQEKRRIEAERGSRGILFWVGMFGLVGWSIAVPTLAGVWIGSWIDRRWPSGVSWTLMLLLCGLLAGCLSAWHWIRRSSSDNEH